MKERDSRCVGNTSERGCGYEACVSALGTQWGLFKCEGASVSKSSCWCMGEPVGIPDIIYDVFIRQPTTCHLLIIDYFYFNFSIWSDDRFIEINNFWAVIVSFQLARDNLAQDISR